MLESNKNFTGGDPDSQERLEENTDAKRVRRQVSQANADTRATETLEDMGMSTLAKYGSKAGGLNIRALNQARQRLLQGNIKGAAAAAIKTAEQFGYDKAFYWLCGLIIPSFGLTIFALDILYVLAKIRKAPLAVWQSIIIGILTVIYVVLIFLIFFLSMYTYCQTIQGQLTSTATSLGSQVASATGFGPEIPDFCKVLNNIVEFGAGQGSRSAYEEFKGTIGVGGSCTVVTENQTASACRPSVLAAACPSWNPQDASKMCNVESGGGTNPGQESGSDRCIVNAPGQSYDGRNIAFSAGIWQINISDSYGKIFSSACEGVLRCSGGSCRARQGSDGKWIPDSCALPKGYDAYVACRKALSNPELMHKRACELYNSRGWQPWRCTASKCGTGPAMSAPPGCRPK